MEEVSIPGLLINNKAMTLKLLDAPAAYVCRIISFPTDFLPSSEEEVIPFMLPLLKQVMRTRLLMECTYSTIRHPQDGDSNECKSFVDRLSNEDKSAVMGWRRELLQNHEFANKTFDPFHHQDWAYVEFITEHFVGLMEASTNPLLSSLAVSYTIQTIFNHLLLLYAHLFHTKWIEVSNDFTGSAKIGGLGISNSSREILLIIEFAGGNIFSLKAKYDSDIKKIYENAVKTIRQSGRNKIFTVLHIFQQFNLLRDPAQI